MPRPSSTRGGPGGSPPSPRDSAPHLADAFGRTAKLLQRTLDETLSEHSRSTPRARVLAAVVASPEPARLTDITALVGVSQATASGLVEGLVGDGLVERVPDPGDGRAKRLVATDAGVAAAAAWREAYVEVVEEIFGGLSSAERRLLGRVLERLAASAAAVSGRQGARGGPAD